MLSVFFEHLYCHEGCKHFHLDHAFRFTVIDKSIAKRTHWLCKSLETSAERKQKFLPVSPWVFAKSRRRVRLRKPSIQYRIWGTAFSLL